MYDDENFDLSKYTMDTDLNCHGEELDDLNCDEFVDGFTDEQNLADFDDDFWEEFTF
jgi:hypothetical protein